MGKGVGRAGKAVGEGTESGVKGVKHKVSGKKSDESKPATSQIKFIQYVSRQCVVLRLWL
jgi:hypothetical protein